MTKAAKTIILYQYRGVATRIKDGDTFVCMVSLGFGEYRELTIRLAKINAPELTSKDPIVKANAEASAAYLSNLILNKTIYFNSKQYDIYGRSIAEIYFSEEDTISINTMMVQAGHAKNQKY